jgi:hypothetical protein
MFDAKMDGKSGNVIWFNAPKPGFIYAAPAEQRAAEPKGEQPILFQDWYEGLSPQWRRVIEAIDPRAEHNGGKHE